VNKQPSFLWDTNVIWRLINSANLPYHEHVEKFLEDAEEGRCKLFTSTVAIAELNPKHISQGKGPQSKFFRDLAANVTIIDTLPQIMMWAAQLRSQSFEYCGSNKDLIGHKRDMDLGDAIFFATCFHLQEAGEADLCFHTFDDGKAKKSGVKSVPILSFKDWCKDLDSVPIIQRAKSIKTSVASHPLCPLPKSAN